MSEWASGGQVLVFLPGGVTHRDPALGATDSLASPRLGSQHFGQLQFDTHTHTQRERERDVGYHLWKICDNLALEA